jgi:hypothetical protein
MPNGVRDVNYLSWSVAALSTRAIQKVTSGELLTKQTMRKRIVLYTKNMDVHKLLLNAVTVRIEALVVSGNKFLYARAKEVCHL